RTRRGRTQQSRRQSPAMPEGIQGWRRQKAPPAASQGTGAAGDGRRAGKLRCPRCTGSSPTLDARPPLQPQPVRRLDEEHVADGRAEHLPQLLGHPEPVVVRELVARLLPDDEERRAGAPLPAEDGVTAEGAEVEVVVAER